MKRFEMIRNHDETGVSGTGRVLEGVVFTDGLCVVRWVVNRLEPATGIYPSFEAFKRIHIDSHPTNKTEINWLN